MRRPVLPLTSSSRALAVALVLGLGACGSDDGDGAADAAAGSTTTAAAPGYGTPGGGGGTGEEGTIVAVDFSLSDLTVEAGADLVLDNQGGAPHTATADDGAFDLGQVEGGQTSDPVAAPDEPGTYGFHCEIHPEMTATLTVEG
jgi:plastocyanin